MTDRSTSPRTVVFDLGAVLIDWNPRHLYRKLIAEEAAMERFLTEVCHHDWNIEQDRGRTWAEATRILVAQYPAERALIEAYRDRWIEMLGDPIAGTVEILEELDAMGTPLYALTNWSAETFVLAEPRMPFLTRFRGVLVSGRVGLIKPDPAIYRRLCADFGLVAENCVFIDDSAANVAGAAGVGFHAVRFTDPAALRRDLTGLGLLP